MNSVAGWYVATMMTALIAPPPSRCGPRRLHVRGVALVFDAEDLAGLAALLLQRPRHALEAVLAVFVVLREHGDLFRLHVPLGDQVLDDGRRLVVVAAR